MFVVGGGEVSEDGEFDNRSPCVRDREAYLEGWAGEKSFLPLGTAMGRIS
jgi:hypothetical protein